MRSCLHAERTSKGVVVAAALFALSSSLGACRDHNDEVRAQSSPQPSREAAPAPAADPLNPVQQEMRLLLAALQGTVAAIADDDLASVPALIHGVHGARAATDAALESGSYRPPKNPDQIEAFKAMDAAFHDELVGLVKAAQADDLSATTTQLGEVLSQCKACHVMFRELPPRARPPAHPEGPGHGTGE